MKHKRIILHIDMDYFFAQIEERENPRFKNKPLVVGSDPKQGKGRGVVSTANYEAREYGINSATPISKAYQACPEAIFLPVDMDLYKRVSENIMEIVKSYSEICEKVSLDEAYLDLSHLKSYNKSQKLGEKLKKDIYKKEKLTATVGIGPNKLIAKMASEKDKPDGLLIVKEGQTKDFLEPLAVSELPGVAKKTAHELKEMGVTKIKDLKKVSRTELEDLFGKRGKDIYERARGKDQRKVQEKERIKSMSKEYTFQDNTRDPKLIFDIFNKILDGLYHRISKKNIAFKTVTVICRFQGFETHTKSKTLNEATNNKEMLNEVAKKLLLKFYINNPKPIRLVGIKVSSFKWNED